MDKTIVKPYVMEIFFNELSCEPLAGSEQLAIARVRKLQKLLGEAKKHGFNCMRCHDKGFHEIKLTEDRSLADFVINNPRDTGAILFLSMIHPPYFHEDSKEEELFVNHKYTLKCLQDDEVVESDCYGLAAAYLYNSIGINLASNHFWSDQKVFDLYDDFNKNKTLHEVISFSDASDFDGDFFFKWCVRTSERRFLKQSNTISHKRCNLSSDHHGNKVLAEFAKQSLFNLPYITEVVTSLYYSPNSKTFVKSIHEESNRIDVVLHWTEQGYGMVLQTNAQDKVELYQMAEELERLFGNK